MKKRDVNLNGIVAFMCLILSIPLYFFYRANLEFEWLFDAVAFLGMFLLVFRFLGPLCVTFFEKNLPGFLDQYPLNTRTCRRWFVIEEDEL